MKFKESLLQGIFIKRYKRFFVDIKYKNKIITAHCPNTGSMMGLLSKNNVVFFSKSDDPNRKLKYTLQIIILMQILYTILKIVHVLKKHHQKIPHWMCLLPFFLFLSKFTIFFTSEFPRND